MGGLKYVVALLALAWFGWDLRLVDWNPIAYVREVPSSDHVVAAMLAGLAVVSWLIDRWTSDTEIRRPRRSMLSWALLIAGWAAILVLLIRNVLELDGNVFALVDRPLHVTFWLLVAAVLGSLFVFSRQEPAFATANTHGSAGWATAADIKPLLSSRRQARGLSIFLGHDRRGRDIVLTDQLSKQLIIGTTGSGKTWSLFLPNARRTPSSLVATDPKGELWDYTSGYQREVWRLAPRSPYSTHGLNWIPLCRDEHLSQLLAAAVMQTDEDTREQQFWKLADQQLCSALFTHVAYSPVPTPATLHSIMQLGPRQMVEHLKTSESPRARTCAQTLWELKPETRAGIVMSVANKLAFLQDPAVRRFTSSELTAPDFRQLAVDPERSIAVYWQVHEQDVDLLQPLSSLFFTLLLFQLCQGEGALPAPVMLLLDEFAQIGRVPKFPNTIAVARGRGVALVLGIQSLGQLEQLYGRAGAEVIRTNCCTKVVLPGLDYDTAEHVSRALGETTVRQEYQSRKPEGWLATSYTYGEHHTQRRLLTADEVRRLADDEELLIIANYRPIRARRAFWNAPPQPAAVGALGPEQTLVVREPVAPPPSTSPLRRGLQQLKED